MDTRPERAEGQKKTFREPNPAEAPVVKRIFTWRLEDRLGYHPIGDRLNLDLTTNPATPNTPVTGVGLWTASNVRDILTNPKHTGHTVWNRRARNPRATNATTSPSGWNRPWLTALARRTREWRGGCKTSGSDALSLVGLAEEDAVA